MIKMKLKKMMTLMTLLSFLLMFGVAGSVFAEPNNVESKSLEVQLKHPVIKLISNVVYEQVPMRGYDNVAMKISTSHLSDVFGGEDAKAIAESQQNVK
jgi:hypothetical protein